MPVEIAVGVVALSSPTEAGLNHFRVGVRARQLSDSAGASAGAGSSVIFILGLKTMAAPAEAD